MHNALPSREGLEHNFRELVHNAGMRQPDEVNPHEDGGIVCLWHEEKLAVIVDLEPIDGVDYTPPGSIGRWHR